MSFICQYCSRSLASKSSLTLHMKTAKYCILIRKNNTPISESDYTCEACNKSYAVKSNYTRHMLNCRNTVLNELIEAKKEIDRLKQQIKYKDGQLEYRADEIAYLKKQLEIKDTLSQQITLAAIAKPTNTNTMIKKQVINNLKPLMETEMKEHIPMLTIDHVKQGGAGYARFAMDYPFKDRIAFSDRARKKLAYKDADGNIVYDNEGKQLSEKLFKVIKEKNEIVFKEILDDLYFKIEEAQDRDEFDEAEVIIDLTEKIRSWKRQANAAGDGIYNELAAEFTKALCKISVT